MLRRFCARAPARSAAVATRQTSSQIVKTRKYYYSGAGEEGIWAETLRRWVLWMQWMCFLVCPFILYKLIHRRYNPDKQWPAATTDRWYSDGTELKGEEAHANLRLQRERIMPIMDKYMEKIEAATAESQ